MGLTSFKGNECPIAGISYVKAVWTSGRDPRSIFLYWTASDCYGPFCSKHSAICKEMEKTHQGQLNVQYDWKPLTLSSRKSPNIF